MVINTNEIEKQAKEILDKFANALVSVEKEGKEEEGVRREDFEREEKEENKENNEFKKLMLQNAPKHDEDFIIAEKGNWK